MVLAANIILLAFEALAKASPGMFLQRRKRRNQERKSRWADLGSQRARVLHVFTEISVAFAILALCAFVALVFRLKPEDLGVAPHDVSRTRLYLVYGAFTFITGGLIYGLFWGAVADLFEERIERGVLGLLATFTEILVGLLVVFPHFKGELDAPRNGFSDTYALLLSVMVIMPWDFIRWIRFGLYGKSGRLFGVIGDLRRKANGEES